MFSKTRHQIRTARLKLASSYRSKQKEKNAVQKDLIPVLYDNMRPVCELLFNFTLYYKTGWSVGGTRRTCGFIQVDHVGVVMHSNASGAGYILSQAWNTNKHQRHFLPLLMPSSLICTQTSYSFLQVGF